LSRGGPTLKIGRAVRILGCVAVALMLTACSSVNFGNFNFGSGPAAKSGAAEVIGTGGVRVAMLLPKSSGGNGADTARAFRNAAELAMTDFPNAGIQIVIYDTRGTPAGAQAAVSAALRDGAEFVLGPVFAGEVSAVAPIARQAGKPVVAFSSDASVAGPGVYLLSFLPSDDVNRIVSYSASQGRRSFAAMLPANAYGAVAEAAFRSSVAAAGGRILAIQSYNPDQNDIRAKASTIAQIAPQIDALLIPDAGDVVPTIAAELAADGITRDRVKFLGSGQWDDARVLNNAALVGSWFPAPVRQGFDEFARKYQAAYGRVPPRNATLAYDATVLAAGLVRQYGGARFDNTVLTSPNGFAGIDGIFRFLPSGLTQRRLAVYELTGAGARVVSPAAQSFAAGG
jgi:ABC-type branched-subunit amino acid transport system substrate-binding protein